MEKENARKRCKEDDYLLLRSNKRIRSRKREDDGERDTTIQEPRRKFSSFEDTLTDYTKSPVTEDSEGWISEDDDEGMIEDREEDPCCRRINFSKGEKSQIPQPWKKTLIIKLLGRPHWLQSVIVKNTSSLET